MLLRNSLFTSLTHTTKTFNKRRTLSHRNRGRKSYNQKFLYSTEAEVEKVEVPPVEKVTPKNVSVPSTYGIAFNSPTWTKFLADVLATEAEIPVPEITAKSLHEVYVQQLQEYRDAKDKILSEKVSESTYEGLLEIFILRSNLPLDAIEKGMEISGINEQKNIGFKGTIGASFTEDGTGETERKGNYFSRKLYERKKRKEGFVFTPNFAKNLLSGISGLVKALDNGLSADQLAKSKSLLGSDSGDIIQMDQPSNVMTPDAGYEQRLALLKQGKVKEAFPEPADLNKQEKETYDKFLAHQTEMWKNPEEAAADIEFTQLVNNSELDIQKMEEFLTIFADKSIKDNEEDIKRMTIYNPLAEVLFSHNLSALAAPDVEFTEDYYEYSGGKLRREDPSTTKGRKGWDVTEFMYNANVGTGEPLVAAEAIMEVKLQRLASWYGLNLENDIDNIKFHVFMDKFEVSPGEQTLEWLMTYPPAHHTFDELPIVKIPSDEDVEDYYKLN